MAKLEAKYGELHFPAQELVVFQLFLYPAKL
jgi:hypothetical protein